MEGLGSDIMKFLDKALTKNYEVEGIVLNKKTVGKIYDKFFKEKIKDLINKKENLFKIPYILINGEKAENYSKEELIDFFKNNGFFELHYLFGGNTDEICITECTFLPHINDIFIIDPFLESLNLDMGYKNHFQSCPIKLNEEYDYPQEKNFSEHYKFEDGKYYKTKERIEYLEAINKNIKEIIEEVEYHSIRNYFIRNSERLARKKNIKLSFNISNFDFLKENKFEYEVNDKKYIFISLDDVFRNLIKIFKKDKYLKFPNKFVGENNLLNFKYGNYLLRIKGYNEGCYYTEIRYITKETFDKYLEKDKR